MKIALYKPQERTHVVRRRVGPDTDTDTDVDAVLLHPQIRCEGRMS
jgi:hypothetical protein